MYNTTTKFGEAIRGDTRSFLAKIISNGKEAEDVIVNLQKYSKSTSGDSIPIGGAISSYVTMDLWNPNFTVKDAEVSVEIGLQLDDAVEWVKLGTFTCEKPTTSSDGLINVTAYDCISTKMSGTYLSDLEYPTDSINVLKELEKKTGVKIDTSGLEKGVLLNKAESMSESDIDEDGNEVTNVTYTNPLDGYTYREVLGYIAMLHCKYAVADVDGTVVFKWFKDVSDYTITGDEYFDDFEDSELEFLVGAISCSTLSQTFESGNGDVNVWLENPIMTQERLDYIYSVLKTLKFVPCHFSFYGDIRLELFDTVKVEKADGTVYNVPIMDVTQDFDGGLKTEIQSFGAGIQEGDGTSGNLLEKVDRFYYELLTVKEIVGKKASFDNLYALNGEFSSLKADNGEFKNLVTENFSAVNANIENLTAKSITTDNLYVKVAEFGYLTAEKADIDYAKIDFSNVGTQVVSSSMIIDGAVTNEKVGNLSANKITSGTIDASKIYVTNLNADNLTVGTINGQRIGDKSIDLNKLAKEVPTKEYLDSVQENLQGQIDGAIETFTKTEIPTLQNEPASLWTDNATKNKHVGDICYVVNPTSSADGYCYRFANLGTEIDPSYEWVLIKDSDVTKTLQDIIDIYGEITGIKKFDTEISAWKVNTDSELSSIKAKTTKLETDIGNRVEVSVFNTLKQTVDENSSSITSLSTTVKNKADGSTVTELANTVNNIKQTADSNSLSISSMKTDIKNKADGSTVETLSKQVSTIDQGLSSVRISVSEETTNRQNDTKRLEGLLEVKVNTEDLISEINASADVINLTGDRIVIDSENFKVAKDGTLEAVNGKFSGELTCIVGTIGGFIISDKAIYKGIDNVHSKETGIYLGIDGIVNQTKSERIELRDGFFKSGPADGEGPHVSVHNSLIEVNSFYDPDAHGITYAKIIFGLSSMVDGVGDFQQFGYIGMNGIMEGFESDLNTPILSWDGKAKLTQVVGGANTELEPLLFETLSEKGNLTIGKGLYNDGSGDTGIYGNDVYIYVKNSAGTPGGYRPYFGAETVNVTVNTSGIVTNSGKRIEFIVPLNRPIAGNNPTVSANSVDGFRLRQGGKYTHGSSASKYVNPSSYTATYYRHGYVRILADFDDNTNATTLDTIGIHWSGSITYA